MTLSGTAIEAAAMSVVAKDGGKESGSTEQWPASAVVPAPGPGPLDSNNTDQPEESGQPAPKSAGKGVEGEKNEGAGGDADADGGGSGRVGTGASRPASRGTSFESVGDVVVVGGVALENHKGFPGEDWSLAQPGAPGSSQVGFFGLVHFVVATKVGLVPKGWLQESFRRAPRKV